MRILHLIHQYPPEKIGGTELYTQTLARRQAGHGHEVAIFTPTSVPPAHQSRLTDDALRIHAIPTGQRSPTAVLRSNFYHPALNAAFVDVLEREQPDVVHIQHLMGLPLNLARRIWQRGIPYVITLHDYWFLCANAQLLTNYDETVCGGPNWWLNCAHCALARVGWPQASPLIPALAPLFAVRHGRLQSILRHAAALIAPSHFTAGIHQQMGVDPSKIDVIPHGIEIPPLPARRPSDGLHIAYIGGIAPQKGVHILIEAINRLPDNSLRLTVYGDLTTFPDYAARLQRQAIHPGVAFAGQLPHARLWQTLAGIDLIVVPTLWYETASLIVQEAFAAGVPVVASNIGVLPERVRQGVDGLLFAPGDAAALADILAHLAQQPERLATLQAGIEPVFTIQAHLAAVMDVYATALS